MAKAIATLKIYPESPDENLDHIQHEVEHMVKHWAGDTERRFSREPIAFGLIAVQVMFVFDEKLGELEPLQEKLKTIKGVQNVDVFDVRRAIG